MVGTFLNRGAFPRVVFLWEVQGGTGRGRWHFGEGGGDISVSRRAFLGRLRRLDGARGVGGLSLEGRGGDGGDTCVVVSSRARG